MRRIFIAEDHHLLREGLKALFAQEKGLVVHGESADGLDTVKQVEELKPDILLLDLTLPRLHGLEVLNQLKSQRHTKVIIVTGHDDKASVLEALRLGAHGYVLKQSTFQELLLAISVVLNEDFYVSASLRTFLNGAVLERKTQSGAKGELTRRESEVLTQAADGKTSLEIARWLRISVRTVEKHRANLMRKLHLRTHGELVRYAIRHHLLEA